MKTRNKNKTAMPPNIISAYKLAKTCAFIIDNEKYGNIGIDYVEIDWVEENGKLKCTDACHGDLFKSDPKTLYINWAAAMQVQFHVCDLGQSWAGTRERWARLYLKSFVSSAKDRCRKMRDIYVVAP